MRSPPDQPREKLFKSCTILLPGLHRPDFRNQLLGIIVNAVYLEILRASRTGWTDRGTHCSMA